MCLLIYGSIYASIYDYAKNLQARVYERLAEYGWGPHRVVLGSTKKLSRASVYWCAREKQRGAVSSSSRFQTILLQRYAANISV